MGKKSFRNVLYVINYLVDCLQPTVVSHCWLSESNERAEVAAFSAMSLFFVCFGYPISQLLSQETSTEQWVPRVESIKIPHVWIHCEKLEIGKYR